MRKLLTDLVGGLATFAISCFIILAGVGTLAAWLNIPVLLGAITLPSHVWYVALVNVFRWLVVVAAAGGLVSILFYIRKANS